MNTYRATNTLNGKFYIGSTKDFEYRKYQHLRSKENYPFQADLRKNPEAFVWEVYTDNLDTNEHEVRLLREFYFDVKCYNLNPCAERPPSQRGKTWWKNELTQKQKRCLEKPEGEGWEKGRLQKTNKKISVANSGKTLTEVQKQARSGEKSYMFGVPKTEAQKKAISEKLSKAIIAIEPDGTQRHFGGINEAARELEIPRSNLYKYLKPGHVPRGKWEGWQFFFKNSENF